MITNCGGVPDSRQKYWQPVQGEQRVFALRFNPPMSLLDRPDLSTEIKAGKGWERISLANPDGDVSMIDQLLDRMRQRPKEALKIYGELTSNLADWPGNHRCRTLRLISIDSHEIQDREAAAKPTPEGTP